MKNFLKCSLLCAVMLAVVVTLTACGSTPEQRYDKIKSGISGVADFTVKDFTTAQIDAFNAAVEYKIVKGFVAEEDCCETFVLLLFEEVLPDSYKITVGGEEVWVEPYMIVLNYLAINFYGFTSFEHFSTVGGQNSNNKRLFMMSNKIAGSEVVGIYEKNNK